MKITIIAGARPNFMKIAPLMRAINAAKAAGKNISARLVYTGSDEDKSLEPSLFTDLDMPRPDAYLRVDDTDFFQRMTGYIEYKNKTQEKCNYCTIYQCISGFYKKNVELHLLLILAIDSVIYSFYVTILLCKKAPVFD